MGWWRRLRQWLQWFDDAQWPNGVPWPAGRPTERPDWRGKITATSAIPIAAVAILIGTGIPYGLGFAVITVVVALVAGYVVREVVREAKRQGWGSNLR